MDTWPQLVMIGKLLADVLELTDSNLKPCPFTNLTSLGGMKWTIGQTKKPLCLMFHVRVGPFIHIFLKCAVTSATNDDILVDQQAF